MNNVANEDPEPDVLDDPVEEELQRVQEVLGADGPGCGAHPGQGEPWRAQGHGPDEAAGPLPECAEGQSRPHES